MVIDDKYLIIGSANINDRSMNGDWDSEIACLIEDWKTVRSWMAGWNFKVAKFAHEFRTQLFMEHFGITNPDEVKDPATDKIWNKLHD